MANKRILRVSHTDAVIKVDGAAGSVTVSLGTDLKLASETVNTPSVNIIGMIVTGASGGMVTVARNSVNLYQMVTDNSPTIDLLEFGNTSDNTFATNDIVITTTGTESQIILKVRKVSGYIDSAL